MFQPMSEREREITHAHLPEIRLSTPALL